MKKSKYDKILEEIASKEEDIPKKDYGAKNFTAHYKAEFRKIKE